jgi:uncharacterized protein YgbK (DUF1537 family)
MPPILKSTLFASLPPEWPTDPFPAIQKLVQADGRKVVVLDDDPTGTQTVHGVPVLTQWQVPELADELRNDLPCFYLLTNTRAMPLAQAQTLNADVGRKLVKAARLAGRGFVPISRSDSTLRGHYPGEVDVLAGALGEKFDATLVVPAFIPGGRHTIGDVHYVSGVVDGATWLTPVGETEFASDKAFGYSASNLKRWVQEKTDGRVKADDVFSISLADIRAGGPARVCERLLSLSHSRVCIANAASDRDLAVFVLGMLQAEAQGKRFVSRTAASFVQLRAGITTQSLLTPAALAPHPASLVTRRGGLIIVGSYVPKTTGQLAALLATGVDRVEVSVSRLLDDTTRTAEIRRATQHAEASLQRGADVVVYTSRELVAGGDASSSLVIGQRVSESLVHMVREINRAPRYVLAKGGITSSDTATQALGVKRALVLGQVLAGVPVWQLGPETKWPGVPYIIFPGNVGGTSALADVVKLLAADER